MGQENSAPAPALALGRWLLRHHPLIALVLLAGLAAGVLLAAGLPGWAQGVATGAAAIVAVWELVTMVREAGHGRWGLDILAVLAIGSTAVLGDYWASLVVALMMTGGEALEDYGSRRARRQLSALLARVPRTALRITAAGAPEEVPLEQLRVGDEVLVTPGAVIPVDGVLLDAAADLDESSLTGESLPVARRRGDEVLSGAMTGAAAVRLRATALPADSEYQQIVRLVEGAAQSRAPFVRLADRLALPFTGVALLIAGLAWVVGGDPSRFAEVLVVATPCPLLIAAPVAFVAGMGRAAKEGVVVKSGESLERLARPRTVAFDKTGTLTRGRPEVDRVEPAPGHTVAEVLAVAAGAERMSNHVLAHAVAEAAERGGIADARIADVAEVVAQGVTGTGDGGPVSVGKAAFVAARTAPFDPAPLAPGEMAIYVGVGSEPIGRIVLRDEVRAESAATVAALRATGVARLVMVTGDAEATARDVGRLVGIPDVRAGLLPGDKVREVAALPERPVLMVGDGVNDAPVLAAADVGVAMGARGATAASETADVVILVDDVARVATAVTTARRTVRIARESIALGIGLSLVFMLVAATGVLPAVIGALLQEAIDVATILNGLRAGRAARPA